MQLPIVAPAPIVLEHSQAFRHLFNDHRQFEHFQNYLTGIIVQGKRIKIYIENLIKQMMLSRKDFSYLAVQIVELFYREI